MLVARRHRPNLAAIAVVAANDALSGTPVLGSRSSISFELGPSLHRDLAAVELTLIFDTGLLCLLPSCLSSVTPGEVVELPESVGGENKVPDGKRE